MVKFEILFYTYRPTSWIDILIAEYFERFVKAIWFNNIDSAFIFIRTHLYYIFAIFWVFGTLIKEEFGICKAKAWSYEYFVKYSMSYIYHTWIKRKCLTFSCHKTVIHNCLLKYVSVSCKHFEWAPLQKKVCHHYLKFTDDFLLWCESSFHFCSYKKCFAFPIT